MECKKITRDKNVASDKTAWSFSQQFRKLTSLKTAYAGLLLFLVPSVICESAWPDRLTYEQIFNNTNYAQIQPYTHVPHPHSHSPNNRYRQQNHRHIQTTNSGETRNGATSYRNYADNSYRHNGETNYKNKTETNYRYSEETKANEIEDERSYGEEKRGKLLVGFARDPFRYSIPEEDYRNGVRHINPQSYRTDSRGKRGVLHLYNMLTCANGCDPLSYKGYGCYCGFLGEGRPTDGIDRCCQMHDKCYENIYCPFYTVYFQPYYWKCWHGEPLCALENYHTQGQLVNGCAGRLCECDRQFAMCVKRYSCPRGRALCRSSPLRLLQNVLMFR